MRVAIVAALLLSATGCRSFFRPTGCGNGRAGEVRCASYEQLSCTPEKIDTINANKWLASGCGKYAVCDTQGGSWVCTVVPPPEQQAQQALLLETGCAAESLHTTAATGPNGSSFGTWRIETCNGAYLCTVDDVAHCAKAASPQSGSGPGSTSL